MLDDQEENITIFWPSISFKNEGCEATFKTSIRYIGLQEFGQEANLVDGYLTIDTKSAPLKNLTSNKLVLVIVKAALVNDISGEELISDEI